MWAYVGVCGVGKFNWEVNILSNGNHGDGEKSRIFNYINIVTQGNLFTYVISTCFVIFYGMVSQV